MSAVAVIILHKTQRICELLEDRAGVKGASLEAGLRSVRGNLPYEARAAGRRLVAAARLAEQGGIVQIDAHRFDDDYRLVLRHLQTMPLEVRRRFSLRRFLMGAGTAIASGALLGVGLAYAGLM